MEYTVRRERRIVMVRLAPSYTVNGLRSSDLNPIGSVGRTVGDWTFRGRKEVWKAKREMETK